MSCGEGIMNASSARIIALAVTPEEPAGALAPALAFPPLLPLEPLLAAEVPTAAFAAATAAAATNEDCDEEEEIELRGAEDDELSCC